MIPDTPRGWRVEHRLAPAGTLHAAEVEAGGGRRLWVQEATGPALVLGSTQPAATVDTRAAAAAGVDVVRRRSGGGAVLVEPGGVVWVDVVVPPQDPLWDDDVGRAAQWVGEAWARALAAVGAGEGRVHRGALVATPWSRLACFGGLGPGEVTVGGRKVVGVAQRRTRAGARFQCAALLRWAPADLVALLALAPAEREAAAADLEGRAAPVTAPGEALLAAFAAALPPAP
ncbi:MAG TPA: hypothetical protein VEW93_08530 [Acidimicrobiales bacterium]|nr:hypothetical protein [Acidimicrobiales bacterium]